jgi:predicted RNase H-like nuclease
MQLVKPMLQKKKSTIQVVKSIKAFYYEVYKKNGLKKLEPWN